MNFLSLLSNFGSIKDKAPQMIAEYLDSLLDEYRPKLNKEDGEAQICYLMTHVRRFGKTEYIIAIVALTEDDKSKRILMSIPLSEAISKILKTMPND